MRTGERRLPHTIGPAQILGETQVMNGGTRFAMPSGLRSWLATS